MEEFLNVLLIALLVLLAVLQKARKKTRNKTEEKQEDLFIEKEIRRQELPKQKSQKSFKEKETTAPVYKDLSSQYKEDPSYQINKERPTSKGKKTMLDKKSIRNGIIVSSIFKRPYE